MDLAVTESPLEQEDFLVIDVERFQGPLDLLLHLIRQQDIDVFEIPVARITRQFLAAIEGIEAKDLDNAGEFIEMAAGLIHIKAQMLLPRHGDTEDEDPRAELVRRLLEYEQIRDVSQLLASAEAERARRFGKGFLEPRPRPPMEETPLETTWDDVFVAALLVTPPDPEIRTHRVTTPPVAMEDKMNLILGTLDRVRRIEFSRLVRPFKSRTHGVMTLLAGLELTRRRRVRLRQVEMFSELWMYPGIEGSADSAGKEDTAVQQSSALGGIMNPTQIVEAVLFASEAPLNAEEIARADEALDEDLIEEAVQELNAAYSESERAFEIRELGEGYQLLTRADFAPYLERFDTIPRPSRLSGPALETLAIIAYRQPIGRIEMEYIRGVSSSGVIHTLQDRGLIDVVARGEGLGRPLLYGTNQRFLEHFGFRSLEDLPRPEELPVILRDRTPLEDLEGSQPLEEAESGEAEVNEPEPSVDDVLSGEVWDPAHGAGDLADGAEDPADD